VPISGETIILGSCRSPPPWSVEELDACYVVIQSFGCNSVTNIVH
jgi:hypothetical protein